MSRLVFTSSARRLLSLVASALLVLGVLAFSSSSAQAADNGHITGTVTDLDGNPIKGIVVNIYRLAVLPYESNWSVIEEGRTDSAGHYDIGGLASNSDYRVWFQDLTDDYVSEYWDDKSGLQEGAPIHVTSPNTVSDIDAQLETPSHITGRLTKAGGGSAGPDIPITVNRPVVSGGVRHWETVGLADTIVGGYYDVTGFGSGTYRLGFAEGDGSYVREYWNDAADLDTADDITVAPESTVVDMDAELALRPPNVTTTGKIVVDADGRSRINIACVQACTGYLQIYSDLAGAKRSKTIQYSVGAHTWKAYNLTQVPLEATTEAKARLFQAGPRDGTVQYNNLEIVRAAGNTLKTTTKVIVDPYGKATVNVSCTQACSGYAQVWSDGTASGPKSSVFHYTLKKADYMPMPLTGLSYADVSDAKVRLAIASPTAFPGDSPQFNSLQLAKGPQNVVKTSSWTKVSSSGKATVNVSCTMACEGYVQLRSDEAGTLKSANVAHYKMSRAGWMPLYFTGVPNINADDWLTRVAIASPKTDVTPVFNALELVKG